MHKHESMQEFQPGEPGYISPDSTPKRSVLDKIKLFHQKVSDVEERGQTSKKWEGSRQSQAQGRDQAFDNRASIAQGKSTTCQVAVTCVEAREVPTLQGDPSPNSCCRVSLVAPGIEPISSETKVVRGTGSPKWKERLIFGIEEDLVKWTCVRIELVGLSESGKSLTHGNIRLIHISELQDQAWIAGWFEVCDDADNAVGKTALRVTIRFHRQQNKESERVPVMSTKEVMDPSPENSGGGSPYSCNSDVSKSPSGPKTQFSSRGNPPSYPYLTSKPVDETNQSPAPASNELDSSKIQDLLPKNHSEFDQPKLLDASVSGMKSPETEPSKANSREAKPDRSEMASSEQQNLTRSPFQLLQNLWEVDSEEESGSTEVESLNKAETSDSGSERSNRQLDGGKNRLHLAQHTEDPSLSSMQSSRKVESVEGSALGTEPHTRILTASGHQSSPPATPRGFQLSPSKENSHAQDGQAVRGQPETAGTLGFETPRIPWAQREQIRRLKSQVAQLQARLVDKELELKVEREKTQRAEERAKALDNQRHHENDRDVNNFRRLQQEVQAERALRLSAEKGLKEANQKIESLDRIINENVEAWMMLEAAVCERISNTRDDSATSAASDAFSTPAVTKMDRWTGHKVSSQASSRRSASSRQSSAMTT